MNKVILMGRLTRDPETRYAKNNTSMAITRYALAVKRIHAKKEQSEADFINVVSFGKSGEFAEKYLRKGQMITLVGRIHQDVWEDADKNKHYNFEVIADEQYFADSKDMRKQDMQPVAESEIAASQLTEEELPF